MTSQAIASSCRMLEQLAVTLPQNDTDEALKADWMTTSVSAIRITLCQAALSSIGTSCVRLVLLRLDASLRQSRDLRSKK